MKAYLIIPQITYKGRKNSFSSQTSNSINYFQISSVINMNNKNKSIESVLCDKKKTKGHV